LIINLTIKYLSKSESTKSMSKDIKDST